MKAPPSIERHMSVVEVPPETGASARRGSVAFADVKSPLDIIATPLPTGVQGVPNVDEKGEEIPGYLPTRLSTLENAKRRSSSTKPKRLSLYERLRRGGRNRRRSSALGTLVNWMLRGQTDEEKVFAHVAQEIERQQKYRSIITTESLWKNRWNVFIGILILYNGIQIPWSFSFGTVGISTLIADYVVDFLFLIDIYLSFKTSYITKTGVEVMNSSMIRARYMKTWFTFDVISIIPFELLVLPFDSAIDGVYFSLFKVPRLLRLGRLMKQFDKLTNANLLRLVKLVAAFCLFAHWVACAWYFIGKFQKGGNIWTGPVWLVNEGLCQSHFLDGNVYLRNGVEACIPRDSLGSLTATDYVFLNNETAKNSERLVDGRIVSSSDRITAYITSLYWAFTTLSTVGFGDIVPGTNIERIFTMFVMLMGSVIYATIFGNVTLIVQNFDKQHARLRSALTQMSSLADFYNLSDQVRSKLRQYATKYTYQVCGVDARRVLNELPQNFRDEILQEMHAPLLCHMKSTIPALCNCSSFLTELLHDSKAILVSMGDSIRVHYFVEHPELYILSEGLMHVYAEDLDAEAKEDKKPVATKQPPDKYSSRSKRRNADLIHLGTHSANYDMHISQQGKEEHQKKSKIMILGAGDIFWGAWDARKDEVSPPPGIASLYAEVNCELLMLENYGRLVRRFPYEMKLLKAYIMTRWDRHINRNEPPQPDDNYRSTRHTSLDLKTRWNRRRNSSFEAAKVPPPSFSKAFPPSVREQRFSPSSEGSGGGGGDDHVHVIDNDTFDGKTQSMTADNNNNGRESPALQVIQNVIETHPSPPGSIPDSLPSSPHDIATSSSEATDSVCESMGSSSSSEDNDDAKHKAKLLANLKDKFATESSKQGVSSHGGGGNQEDAVRMSDQKVWESFCFLSQRMSRVDDKMQTILEHLNIIALRGRLSS